MKVFIGTMTHGEGEFDECKRAISQQVDVDTSHIIISNLPEKEAHERLYTTWNSVKEGHELFLKVDADTVLAHEHVISDYVKLFEANVRLTGVQAWLYDHMTDTKIFGLTCLRNTVTVSPVVDKLYCDRADTGHDIVMRGDELPASLNPAGTHCQSATDTQAFHYGFHRGKKNQQDIRARVLKAWKRDKDRQRGIALIGFMLSAQSETTNYDTFDFQRLYHEATSQYDTLVKKAAK